MDKKTKPKVAYTPITMYQTADGAVHASTAAAQEHVEAEAGAVLSELVGPLTSECSGVYSHSLICHLLRNHQAFSAALAHLHAFEPIEDDE